MDKEMGCILGGILLVFLLLIGALLWSGQDFANRCERAGGVLVHYDICLTKDSTVLMTQ
jgi:hypothetical protein